MLRAPGLPSRGSRRWHENVTNRIPCSRRCSFFRSASVTTKKIQRTGRSCHHPWFLHGWCVLEERVESHSKSGRQESDCVQGVLKDRATTRGSSTGGACWKNVSNHTPSRGGKSREARCSTVAHGPCHHPWFLHGWCVVEKRSRTTLQIGKGTVGTY